MKKFDKKIKPLQGLQRFFAYATVKLPVKLQEGCDLKAKDVANEVAKKLSAEFVQAIGHKFTLYRESKENKQIVLPH